jgi:hypothetical protein
MIENPLSLQSSLNGRIPASHLRACADAGTPTEGNAAGNTLDLLDLSGENKAPGTLPVSTHSILLFKMEYREDGRGDGGGMGREWHCGI